jgi:hypothetical protein
MRARKEIRDTVFRMCIVSILAIGALVFALSKQVFGPNAFDAGSFLIGLLGNFVAALVGFCVAHYVLGENEFTKESTLDLSTETGQRPLSRKWYFRDWVHGQKETKYFESVYAEMRRAPNGTVFGEFKANKIKIQDGRRVVGDTYLYCFKGVFDGEMLSAQWWLVDERYEIASPWVGFMQLKFHRNLKKQSLRGDWICPNKERTGILSGSWIWVNEQSDLEKTFSEMPD